MLIYLEKKFGKQKIMPTVSPKKSWEGFIGGLFSTIVSVILFKINFFTDQVNLLILISIGIILPFTATLGDF